MKEGRTVVLCQMPWASTTRPSVALGIITSICSEAGLHVHGLYPNLDISAEIGFKASALLAEERPLYGLSEHFFSVDIFGKDALRSDEYLESFVAAGKNIPPGEKAENLSRFFDISYLKYLRDEVVPRFMEETLKRVLAHRPDMAGFSATFNQVMGSLALAKRIKHVSPDTLILMGGANFDGEMGVEYHRALPEVIDHVFLGEAEESLRCFLARWLAGEGREGIPGVTFFRNGRVELSPGKPLSDMELSPIPNYASFFEEAFRVKQATGKVFNVDYIPFEGARGCWWGQKNHCIFCGLNDELISYRSKSVDRIVEDIVLLSSRYGVVRLNATDCILSHRQADELFERLIDLDLDVELFFEVRSSLKKEQIMKMLKAGITRVQPGIESLSTPVLKLMGKGTTLIRQIMFLRWCRETGVKATYNILAGFPDEKPEWYSEMAALIPRIGHLQPPSNNFSLIEMHRFAPLYERRESFGVEQYCLRDDYSHNFPENLVDPLKTAYFFRFRYKENGADLSYLQPVADALSAWIERHKGKTPPTYEYCIGPGFLQIRDYRNGEGRIMRVAGIYQDVVLLCDEVRTRMALMQDLQPLYPRETSDGTLGRVIDELIEADVLMEEGSHLLTLPIGHRPRTTRQLRSYVLGGAGDLIQENKETALTGA